MDTRHFEQTLGALAATLGDPTRRSIYLRVRGATEPPTAAQLAEHFSIHPNVARHHLDRLVDDGYLVVAPGHRDPGAGRPARHYRPTDKEISVNYPPRRYDLLSELLVRVVEQLDPETGPDIAEQVGRTFGRDLAVEIGLAGGDPENAVAAVAGALSAIGFGIADSHEDSLVTSHCPFGATAADHPEVVCRIDQGIVKGLMEVARGGADGVLVSPHQGPDEACLTEV
jgi:predicted ArsR family transcriptional regulator